MKKLLPQANNLDTIVKAFIYYGNKKNCTLDDVAHFCNFEVRQASYYINACGYLNLISEDGQITKLGNDILDDSEHIRDRIYELIISDELIGRIFAHFCFFREDNDFVVSLLKEKYSYIYQSN